MSKSNDGDGCFMFLIILFFVCLFCGGWIKEIAFKAIDSSTM